ncbi:MAG: outer membrane beta-barrel family protein [Paludibacter sp.]
MNNSQVSQSRNLIFCLLLFLFSSLTTYALEPISVKGCIIEKSSGTPLEFATVVVKNKKDSLITQSVTDKNGWFVFKGIPNGDYFLSYSFIGFEKIDSVPLNIPRNNQKVNLGKLYLSEAGKQLSQVEVMGQRSTFVNSIDRKIFNVGQDLMSKSGSVSELMQNIPSVQVDMDGNVSLRGSENVTVLIDGKPSAMMKVNRAAVLQQMSANNVEKIEIITNPSAKYKPDGTAGIINIVMKKNRSLGLNGNVIGNLGNEGRWNFNGMLNYNPGKLNLFGSFGMRLDARNRINDLSTTIIENNVPTYLKTLAQGKYFPLSYIGSVGADYKFDDNNKLSTSVSYNYRYQELKDSSKFITATDNNYIFQTVNYIRNRDLPEIESDLEMKASYLHRFNKEGHELNIDLTHSITYEEEKNYYINNYRIPGVFVSKDNMFYEHNCTDTELTAEYTLPISDDKKFEAGYIYQRVKNDLDLKRDTFEVANDKWNVDTDRSNKFIRTENTHVLYATYEQEIGKFGFLAGIRAEQTFTNANLVTLDSTINIPYFRFYPTLHMSYKLTDMHELQLNYSHRIRRPEDEELNPFPEYQDLQNIRAGNPYLMPEDTHSFEFGYQLKKDITTFLSTLYYRNSYNLITSVIQNMGNGVLKSTLQNLDRSQSAGLELILSSGVGKFMTFNLSSNIFYNTIDATLLGFGKDKSTVSWSANGNVSMNLTKSTTWQITSNYSAKTLTPQGNRMPIFVMNTGIKQELFKKNAALIFTVSDIFNTMRYQYQIDTPTLVRTEIRRRSAQTIYLGFTYNFGAPTKKQKEGLKFDNSL